MTIDDLRREALRLDPAQRADLAQDLLDSLEDLSETEIEALWTREARRRYRQIVDGVVETVSMEEALAKARSPRR